MYSWSIVLWTLSRTEIKLPEGLFAKTVTAQTLHDDDLLAKNTLDNQNRVVLHDNDTASLDGETGMAHVVLPPVSWTALHFA